MNNDAIMHDPTRRMSLTPWMLVGIGALLSAGIAGCGDPPPGPDSPSDAGSPPPVAEGVVDLPGDDDPRDDSPDGMTGGVLAADEDG